MDSKQKLHKIILEGALSGELVFWHEQEDCFVAYTKSQNTITVYIDDRYYDVDGLKIEDDFEKLLSNIEAGKLVRDEENAHSMLDYFRI